MSTDGSDMQEGWVLDADHLRQALERNEVGFIFDLRNSEDYVAWRVEGRTGIESLNIPQTDFVGDEKRHLARLPKDRRILTVCAHGDSSKYAAEFLRERGYDAVTLAGGMEAWSELYEDRLVSERPLLHQVYRTARGCIGHLLISGGEAVVIDAQRHIDRFLNLAAARKARIVHVFDTHLQADHISGGRDIALRSGAAYHLHPDDAAGAAFTPAPLADGQVIRFGESRIDVIHAPGHTPGSTALLLDRRFLFAGDTIMPSSIGRPDLDGKAEEWSEMLFDTLYGRFRELSDDIVVLPTHAASVREQGPDGIVRISMGEARRTSDLYQIKDLSSFTAYVRTHLPENPERYQDIRKVNLGLLVPEEAKRKELEIGRNLCGMAPRQV